MLAQVTLIFRNAVAAMGVLSSCRRERSFGQASCPEPDAFDHGALTLLSLAGRLQQALISGLFVTFVFPSKSDWLLTSARLPVSGPSNGDIVSSVARSLILLILTVPLKKTDSLPIYCHI